MSIPKELICHRTEDIDLAFCENGTLEVYAYCERCGTALRSIDLNKEETKRFYEVMKQYYESTTTKGE